MLENKQRGLACISGSRVSGERKWSLLQASVRGYPLFLQRDRCAAGYTGAGLAGSLFVAVPVVLEVLGTDLRLGPRGSRGYAPPALMLGNSRSYNASGRYCIVIS